MSAVDPDARQLAQCAAVVGRIDDGLVTRAAFELGMTVKRVLALVNQLHQHGLIDEGMPARFRHALTRDAVYRTIDPVQRKVQHANAAQFLINRDPRLARAEAAYIARHLEDRKSTRLNSSH